MTQKPIRPIVLAAHFGLFISVSAILCTYTPCHAQLQPAPSIPFAQLLKSPEQICIASNSYRLDVMPYLNCMPPQPCRMIVLASLVEVNGNSIPARLILSRVWVIDGADYWETIPDESFRNPILQSEIKLVARDGPPLGKNPVDVIVQIMDAERSYFLRASKQEVKVVS